MKILFLGGTQFLGRAAAWTALDRGHEVTLYSRGKTNPHLFPQAERVVGDRAVDELPKGAWDAVVDTSGYVPAVVRRSAKALCGSAERYLFVSSISVYANFREGSSEDAPLAELGDMPDDELLPGYENYGPLKALCEGAAADAFGERSLVVRPGLIVGPHDPTGRFTYWPHRIARGGPFVAPAPPQAQVQLVDARDLGAWLVDLVEERRSGVFNATHPGLEWSELVDACLRVTGSGAEPVWIDGDWLAARGVGQWMELPLWVHDADLLGLHRADVSRAIATGLGFRPLEDTVRSTLELASTTEDAGLAPQREARLLEAWRGR